MKHNSCVSYVISFAKVEKEMFKIQIQDNRLMKIRSSAHCSDGHIGEKFIDKYIHKQGFLCVPHEIYFIQKTVLSHQIVEVLFMRLSAKLM